MELVFLSKSRGALARVQLRFSSAVVAVLLFTSGAAGLAYWGYLRGADAMSNAIASDPEYATSFWQVRAGALQAHVTRLDALAERLVNAAGLDPDEFGLTETPALGGPAPENFVPPEWTSLLANLETLGADLVIREDRLEALESLIFDRQLSDDMHPDGRPLEDGWISSGFGYRTHPVSGAREFHSGIDFAGKPGLEVKAVASGIVTWSGKRWGYGNLVELNHGNGYVTRYAHNKKNLVEIGDRVDKDAEIRDFGASISADRHRFLLHFRPLRLFRTNSVPAG